MILMAKLDRHAALVNRMAAVVGADPGAALTDGRLTPEALRGAVMRCTHCDAPEACKCWLEGRADGSADTPPDYCLNRALFVGLKTGAMQ